MSEKQTPNPKRLSAIQKALYCRYCTKTEGRLHTWPTWLKNEHLEALIEAGLATRKFYQFAWGHEDFYIKPPEGESLVRLDA